MTTFWPRAKRTACASCVELAFSKVGRKIEWRGKGVDEIGIDAPRARRW